MRDKNFLNIHVLISHSPSCLNRDDMNMQKSAIFGGVRRVRISSQSLKRAMRKSAYYAEHLGVPSDRTRDLARLKNKYSQALKGQFSPEMVAKTIALVVGKPEEVEAEEAEKEDSKKDKKVAVAPWSVPEIARLCQVIQDAETQGLTALTAKETQDCEKKAKKAVDKAKKSGNTLTFEEALQTEQLPLISKKLPKIVTKESQNLLAALRQTVDIALSGRMATSGLMTSIDGALALAHTITTHAADADIDWFTAVDDLVSEGSGHLDTQEFSAGVFYRYASLNIGQLQTNLGNASRQEALKIGKHLVHLLATVVPTAKQNSFAAHNLADFVLVSFGDMPISAANAFEEPIKPKKGLLKPSITAFQTYWKHMQDGYSLNDQVALFSLLKDEKNEQGKKLITLFPCYNTLAELQTWVTTD